MRHEILFLILLLLMPFLAWLKPEWGAHADILNQLCVAAIFFISGVCFKPEVILRAAQNFKLNVAIQFFCFALIPYVIFLASHLLFPFAGLYPPFITGSLIMSCLPITISSCVLFTSLVNGDEKAALFNAILSNFVGVFTAPIALSYLMGFSGATLDIHPLSLIFNLSLIVLLPLILGHIAAPFCVHWLNNKERTAYQMISELFLLFIIYSAFCNSILDLYELQFPWEQIVHLAFWMLLFHLSFLFLAYLMGYLFKFPEDQRKTILFTAPQKTVAIGIPLNLAIVSSASQAGLYMLPLLIYNNIQWLMAGLLVYLLRKK